MSHFYPDTQDYRFATELSLFTSMSTTQSAIYHDIGLYQKDNRAVGVYVSQFTLLHLELRIL